MGITFIKVIYELILNPSLVFSFSVVPDTTGKEFFLPSTTDLDPFPLLDILEVVATRAGKGQASQANLTLTTTSGDVVLALTIPTNQTAHISLQNLGRGNGDGK